MASKRPSSAARRLDEVLALHLGHGIADLALLDEVVGVPVLVVVAVVGRPVGLGVVVASGRRVPDGGEGTGVDQPLDRAGRRHGGNDVAHAVDGTVVHLLRVVGPAVAHRRADVQHGTTVLERCVVAAVFKQVRLVQGHATGVLVVQGEQELRLVRVRKVGDAPAHVVATFHERDDGVGTDVARGPGDRDGTVG